MKTKCGICHKNINKLTKINDFESTDDYNEVYESNSVKDNFNNYAMICPKCLKEYNKSQRGY